MKCELHTEFPYEVMERLFRTELARKHDRSAVELADTEGNATFTITADDVAALRAALNGVTSILQVHEHGQRFSRKDAGA